MLELITKYKVSDKMEESHTFCHMKILKSFYY